MSHIDNKRKVNTATEENVDHKKSKVEQFQDVKSEIGRPLTQQGAMNFDGMEFFQKLICTKAMNIRTRDEIIFSANKSDKLHFVFKGLCERRFLSVPVFQKTDKKKWYGFVDLSDIVHYVTTNFGTEKFSMEKDFWKLTSEEEKFKALTVKDVISSPFTKANKYNPITQNYSLYSAFEIFARDPNVHRIPILDNMHNRHLLSILTQSQLIKYVYDNLPLLGLKKDLLVKNFQGVNRDVITVKDDVLAIDAFKILDQKGISGLGILNQKGQLIDTLSVRDLKGMAFDGSLFWKLYKPVGQFLEYIKNDQTTLRPRNAVWALETDTFETVLTKIYTNQIHRIFIVDNFESKKPIAVIALYDLLNQLFP
ncbi:CBS (cystathionine-beta-synthase) domain-containing protein [Tieghemostelium lacteum]|uniref:CBS (Cystathionine-beta-synthase) domain-containing protein n=1 Tax=Tieghemostelium lacteum TaxID=361077 RepID=A0A151Z956_TIELA|nr:CBS (cystathionine-beta-synthase) domain-containing protein [Tieghemostelium lacteum]|eukprot:KYQ90477.1 CBS (cystathionine-beta-synthase) domain-containing protein [Tieghemostelium lacteum]